MTPKPKSKEMMDSKERIKEKLNKNTNINFIYIRDALMAYGESKKEAMEIIGDITHATKEAINETASTCDKKWREIGEILNEAEVFFQGISHKEGEGSDTKLVTVQFAKIAIEKEKWKRIEALFSPGAEEKEE